MEGRDVKKPQKKQCEYKEKEREREIKIFKKTTKKKQQKQFK